MFWQQWSRMPTRAEWDALYAAAPILDDEGLSMRANCEHYMLHSIELEKASGGLVILSRHGQGKCKQYQRALQLVQCGRHLE